MLLETFTYNSQLGWSVNQFPPLDSANTLVMVFGAPEFISEEKSFAELAAFYSQAKIVGCSTAGEIFGDTVNDHSLSVAVIQFLRTTLACATAPVEVAKESYAAGQLISEQLGHPTLRGVLVFSDGLQVNGSELVRGINATLSEQVIVTGGLAADNDQFKQTWVLVDNKPTSAMVTAVGFYGEHIQIGHGSKGGWDIFGPERKVTRAEGNQLFELDGKPALQLYKEYLGERAAGLPAAALLFPLALRLSSAEQKQIVRTIIAVNEKNQSMTFAGDVPHGALAQLMRANIDRLIDGASVAAEMSKPQASGNADVLSLAISCVGRRLILGERAEEELEATLDVLPPNTQQIGFYSYGEISPYQTGQSDLHNQTMTLTTIFER